VIRAPEAAVFAAVTDAVVAPEPPLPPVSQTDAVAAFAALLAVSPAANRLGLRLLLRALTPLRHADRAACAARLDRLERTRAGGAIKALRSVAHLCYYGDAGVLAVIGYDPAAVVARGRAVREAEGRW
jgi:hypothetical protein